jgi:hypothetical protein
LAKAIAAAADTDQQAIGERGERGIGAAPLRCASNSPGSPESANFDPKTLIFPNPDNDLQHSHRLARTTCIG